MTAESCSPARRSGSCGIPAGALWARATNAAIRPLPSFHSPTPPLRSEVDYGFTPLLPSTQVLGTMPARRVHSAECSPAGRGNAPRDETRAIQPTY